MAPPPMALRPGGHVCGVGATPAARAELAAAWVREGLTAGERVLWIGTDGSAGLEWLGAHDVAWRQHARDGSLVSVGAREIVAVRSAADITARVDQVERRIEEAQADGYAGLRVGADAAQALACMPDLATQFRFEAAWEELTRRQPMSFLCLYDPAEYGSALATAVAAHPRALADGMVFLAAEAGRLRVTGEIDLSNVDTFGRFAAAAAAAGAGDMVVDLAGLSFIDARGTSALVDLGRALTTSHRLQVASAPPMLRRILDLTGWSDEFELL